MKPRNVIALAFASALVFTLPVHAAETKKTDVIKGVGEVEINRAIAIITAIDAKTRVVTLKGEDGNTFTITAGPEVRNFDKLKVGDKVTIDSFEAIAVEAKKTEAAPSITETIEGERAKKGEQPGAIIVRKVHIVTEVLGNNVEMQTVAVRGPLGNVTQVKIRDPKVFAALKGGGRVDLTYVEGMAIVVTPGGKK